MRIETWPARKPGDISLTVLVPENIVYGVHDADLRVLNFRYGLQNFVDDLYTQMREKGAYPKYSLDNPKYLLEAISKPD